LFDATARGLAEAAEPALRIRAVTRLMFVKVGMVMSLSAVDLRIVPCGRDRRGQRSIPRPLRPYRQASGVWQIGSNCMAAGKLYAAVVKFCRPAQ
jgi:hypothetical protein